MLTRNSVKLYVRTASARPRGQVFIQRSRLEKVSPWFKRAAAYQDAIELGQVTANTLRAFEAWIYDDVMRVEGLQEEMDSATERRIAQAGSASRTIIEDLTEDMGEDKENNENDDLDSCSQEISGS
jgi:hypothetical protein